MSGIVHWWLKTNTGDWHNGHILWTRVLTMAFLPTVEDRCHILTSEEEPEGSVLHRVKSRWFDHNGTVNLEFVPFIIDPDENCEGQERWLHTSPWRTEQEGSNLIERLEQSMWRRY